MPDFEMPAAPQAPIGAPVADAPAGSAPHPVGAPPPRRSPAPSVLDASDLTAEPDASDDRPRPRPRLAWRQLLVAGLIGALLGAAVPASLQALERAAAAAEVATLRTLATDYLTAIAEGRAADATALVPLAAPTAEIAPDAVLAAARPIERIEVGLVTVDGDAASVAVRYGGVGADRMVLDAERAEGRWRLTTSLAEPVVIYPGQVGDEPTIAGVPLLDRRSYLYPGRYELDEHSGPVISTTGQSFRVDGDQSTVAEVYTMSSLAPEISAMAAEIGLRAAEACMGSPGCLIREGARLTVQQDAYVQLHDARSGMVELGVPLLAASGAQSEWFDVSMRMHYDEAGMPTSWECGRPGEFATDLEPCPGTG